MANLNNGRIVVLIDMDCFFCQVETKLQPEYAGKPLAVVQYNQWQLGGIIAVNYEAREYGVTRHMRGEEAKEKCPELVLASVPCLRGKADTSRYRSAGREVIDVIKKHCSIIERASVDEAYLDITDIVDKRISTNSFSRKDLEIQLSNTFIVGYSEVGKNDEEERSKGVSIWLANVFEESEDEQAQKLALAGVIVEELRTAILEETGFKCSAGIAQNKILAKLACGLHKPNRQTILPLSTVSSLYSTLPIKKVRNLGGKFGDVIVESLNCNVMGDLLQYSLQYLQKRFDDKTGLWLYNIARGIDNEPVVTRLISKSIGACKKFPGKQAIISLDVLRHWAGELSAEVCERLEQDLLENERRATLFTICYHYYQNKTTVSQSRSCTLTSYKPERMANRCVEMISKSTQSPIAYLGISAGKFVPSKNNGNLMNFFKLDKMGETQKINIQTENVAIKCIDTVNNTTEIISNVDSNESASNSKICAIKTASSSGIKNVTQSPRSSIQFDLQISKEEIDKSPTSSRLNKLIKSLNERNKKTVHYNFSNSLDKNDFKESFFMNVLNSKENKSKDIHTCDNEFAAVNDIKNIDVECKNLNENNIQENEENDFRDVLKLNAKECNRIIGNNEEEEQQQMQITNANNNGNYLQSTVKLEEIFPDLSNIDLSVVALLPLNLQEEAKAYMKTQNKKDNMKGTVSKNTKGKSKSKTNTSKIKKNNGIYNFLVKRESTNFIEVSSKQCTRCYQTIPLLKYQEHCDFHVAEDLQKELNNSVLQTTNVKRKVDTSDVNTDLVKRRSSTDT